MFGGSAPSLADIAAVTGNNGNNNDGFGGNNGWWVLIILFALFGGWGRGGYGYGDNGNNGGGYSGSFQGALTRGDLCMDMNFNELQSAVRNISDTVNLGFANLNSTICAQQYETSNLLNQMNISNLQTANAQNIAAMQNQNALTSQIAQCCCDMKSMFADANYNRATDTCTITRAVQDAARDIINNDNANYRQLHDEQLAIQMQQKDAQIAQLTAALNKCDSQNIANAAVASAVAQIRPTPGPAWIVPNPYSCYQYPYQNQCCNNGYGTNFNVG